MEELIEESPVLSDRVIDVFFTFDKQANVVIEQLKSQVKAMESETGNTTRMKIRLPNRTYVQSGKCSAHFDMTMHDETSD